MDMQAVLPMDQSGGGPPLGPGASTGGKSMQPSRHAVCNFGQIIVSP